MAFRLKLSVFLVLLLLSMSYCHGKNLTVQVIGLIHCRDCFGHEVSSSHKSLGGISVFIHCMSGKRETNTLGNGHIDREGKFNITLSADMITRHDCFAELQSQSNLSCPIQSPKTASVKFLHTEYHNSPINLNFSPVTCQSAFFCLPHPKNITFPHPSPPTEYTQLPPSEAPPLENPIPWPSPASEPLYSPPTPTPDFQSPQIPPYNGPISPHLPKPIPPPVSKQLPRPPSKAFHQTPSQQSPIPPPHPKEPRSQTPTAPPTEYAPQPPETLPPKKSIPPPSPASEPSYLPPKATPIFQSPQVSPSNGPISPHLPKPFLPPVYKQLPGPPPKSYHQTPSPQSPIPPHHPKKHHSQTPTAPPLSEALSPEKPIPSPSPASEPSYLPPKPTPAFHSPQRPASNGPISSQLPKPVPPPVSKHLPGPPPKAFHRTPSAQSPISSPIPTPTPFAPRPLPPKQRTFNPIPRAPPLPKLPPLPPVPRKYFNPRNSRSQPPPHSSSASSRF